MIMSMSFVLTEEKQPQKEVHDSWIEEVKLRAEMRAKYVFVFVYFFILLHSKRHYRVMSSTSESVEDDVKDEPNYNYVKVKDEPNYNYA